MNRPVRIKDVPKPRTKFLDFDARYNSKTNFCCVMCQRDLKPQNSKIRWVHIVHEIDVLHPEDEGLYIKDDKDRGTFPIGPECVRKLGIEWTHAKNPQGTA